MESINRGTPAGVAQEAKPRALLFISVVNNDDAVHTLNRWLEAARSCTEIEFDVGLLAIGNVSASERRRLKRSLELGPPTDFYVMDDEALSVARAVLSPDDPNPLSTTFSYPSKGNAGLILGGLANCEFVLCLDKDTLPPDPFPDAVSDHVRVLTSGQAALVSGTYGAQRFAVRTQPILMEHRDAFLDAVGLLVGVDVRCQLTAGAMLTQHLTPESPGIPGPPVEGYHVDGKAFPSLLFSTDDGMLPGVSGCTGKVLGTEIRREVVNGAPGVGKEKGAIEYFSGIAAAGYFASTLTESSDASTTSQLNTFCANLLEWLDRSLPSNRELLALGTASRVLSALLPDALKARIREAHGNYQGLRVEWPRIHAKVVQAIQQGPSDLVRVR